MRAISSMLLAITLLAAAPVSAQEQKPRITVTGQGEVTVAPDMATVWLGVTSTAKQASDAMAETSGNIAAVREKLKAAGIAERDLQTSEFSLGYNHSGGGFLSSGSGLPEGFTARNTLSVRVRDLSKLGEVLDVVVQAGANTLSGISFDVADPAPLMVEARKSAVADARARAELLTSEAGVKLGAVQSIVENAGYQPTRHSGAVRASKSSGVSVAEGEITLSASVTIEWEIKE